MHPRRVRATKDGATVVDSERVRLVYRTGSLPGFAFPAEDVRVASEPEPAVDGYVTVPWDAVDTWLEEDEEIVVHPRDPYHRIDVLDTSRRVIVRVKGEELGATSGARILFETALPPRYYVSRDDVRMGSAVAVGRQDRLRVQGLCRPLRRGRQRGGRLVVSRSAAGRRARA